MHPRTRIVGFGSTVDNGDSALETLLGGVMLLLVGLVVLVMRDDRRSRIGGAGLIVWGACLVIPVAAGVIPFRT